MYRVDRVVYRYRATRAIEFGKFGTWKMRNGNRKTESNCK